MIKYLKTDPWLVIEEGFEAKHHRSSESIFSLGNGTFGQRACHEEKYSGPTLQGSYVAGVYYPDKTRVGWWKNGYPEYFAKVLNSVNWNSLHIAIHGEALDLNAIEVLQFQRVLDMKEGTLKRNFEVRMRNGVTVTASTERFCSMQQDIATSSTSPSFQR
jgi:maltose phosphorylase